MENNAKQRSLVCYSVELLYKIADAGYLEKLNEVRPDRLRTNGRIYYFDRDPEIEKIINDYQSQKQKEKAEKQKAFNVTAESIKPFSLSDEDRQAIISGIVEQLEQKKQTESSDTDVK